MKALAMNRKRLSRYEKTKQYIANFKIYFEEVEKSSNVSKTAEFIHHGGTNRYLHSVAVAYYSYRVAMLLRMRKNLKDLVRGAIVHDYFLYNSKEHLPEFRGHMAQHPDIALMNAETEFLLTDIERDVIRNHMFPVTHRFPKYKEALLVSLVDKACAVYEFFKRSNPYPTVTAQLLPRESARTQNIPMAIVNRI